jgi:hypothetical protein
MGTVVPTNDEAQTQAMPEYKPTPLEKKASEDIKKYFEASSKYWRSRHDVQKRLWARYLNQKMQEKDSEFSNVQTGRLWYICDVVDSILSDSLLDRKPYGKIRAEDVENFPGSQDINQVNGWQQQQRNIKSPSRDSMLHSVVTGTGVKLVGWEYYIQEFRDVVDKTLKMVNPADPANVIEIPTGEKQETMRQTIVDRLSCIRVDEWLTFPPAGGVNPQVDPYCMFLVKYNRKQLRELEENGFIKNVDYIDEGSYGAKQNDEEIGDLYIDRGKKQEQHKNLDKDSLWTIWYVGLYRWSEDGEVPPKEEADQPVIIIKTKYDDTILKFDENPYPGVPVVRDRYSGTDDEWFGRSFTEIIEKLIKLDENMYGYVNDAALRELFRRTFVSDKMSTAQIAKWHPDQIVKVPDSMMQAGKAPYTENPNPHLMVNMQEQRRITTEILDEISGVLDFVRGGDVEEQEKATMTTARVNFLNKRFKNRIKFYEDNGMQEFMEWQCVLNHLYLKDDVVEQITETPAWLNPFKMIQPIMPLRVFQFEFEGSTRAADNPVLAQIYKQLLDVAKGLPPGIDENGNLVQANLMTLYRQLVRKTAPDDDIDDYFMPALGMGMGMPGQGGGDQLGAVTPADLLPQANAGIRPETR